MRAVLYEFDRLTLGHLGGYIFQAIENRRLTTVCHAHDFYELIWLRRGWATQSVNGAPLTLRAGEALLLRPAETHYFLEQTDEISLLSLSVAREELAVMAGAFSPLLTARLARAEGPLTLTLGLPLGEVRGDTEFDCKYLLSFVLRAYMEAAEPAVGSAALPPSLSSLEAAMRERENLRSGIAAALAHTHYSQSHLARLVRAHWGMGLKEWINELRLREAYRELILSDRAVTALADEVGYASPAHFCRIFKARFGMSPAALRRSRGMHTV